MKERLKAPELRFDGFTDDWEQRKFADFIDVKSGKDYNIWMRDQYLSMELVDIC